MYGSDQQYLDQGSIQKDNESAGQLYLYLILAIMLMNMAYLYSLWHSFPELLMPPPVYVKMICCIRNKVQIMCL